MFCLTKLFSLCFVLSWKCKKYVLTYLIIYEILMNIEAICNWIQFFSDKKFRICVYFFTCILPNYMADYIFKDFLRNSLFENMTAGFLLMCQKSLWQEINLICHWNIDSLKQRLSFVYGMVQKNDQDII